MRSSLSSPRGMSINDMHLQERTIGWNIKISKAQWPFMINLKMVVNENTKCAVKQTLIWIERLVFIHIQRCTLLWYVITFYNDVDSVYLLFMNHILTLFKTTPLWLESFLYNGWMWTCWCCEFCLTVVESYPERKFYKFRRPEAQISRSDSKLTHNQLETSLQSNAVSLWLGENLKWGQKRARISRQGYKHHFLQRACDKYMPFYGWKLFMAKYLSREYNRQKPQTF